MIKAKTSFRINWNRRDIPGAADGLKPPLEQSARIYCFLEASSKGALINITHQAIMQR